MILLNSVVGVGSVGAWVRGWRGSNFGVGGMGGVGPLNFGIGQKTDVGGVGRDFGVGGVGS